MNSTVDKVGWVAEPDGRGTTGLLWSCFATIFICTWSAVHPNVPADEDSQWKIFFRKLGYMLVGFLAPEFLAMLAFQEFRFARQMKTKRNVKHPSTSTPWTLKHYFFVIMGGFTIESTERIRPHSKKLFELFRDGSVLIPEIDESDIDDRSKADWFTKSIALVQIVWFVTQLIGRAIQRLPVTTLELFTLGIVFCTLITYGLWWQKPFDVKKTIVLQLGVGKEKPGDIGRVSIGDLNIDGKSRIYFLIVAGACFGALHVVGWDFEFPTEVEKVIWRVASICCGAIPILVGTNLLGGRIFNAFWDKVSNYVFYLLLWPCYLMVRIYLFAEMLAGLRAVPPGVYKTPKWSQYFPSFG